MTGVGNTPRFDKKVCRLCFKVPVVRGAHRVGRVDCESGQSEVTYCLACWKKLVYGKIQIYKEHFKKY